MEEESELCIVCGKRPPHLYVQGTGEYLSYTCLICHRRSRFQPNFIESGSTKNGRTKHFSGKEDK